jgi:hypothetical protein
MPTLRKQKDKVPVTLPSPSPPPPQLKKRGRPPKATKIVKLDDLEEAETDAPPAKKPRATSKTTAKAKAKPQAASKAGVSAAKNRRGQIQAATARDKLPVRDGRNEHPGLHPGAGPAPCRSRDEVRAEREAVKEAAENKARSEATAKHTFAMMRIDEEANDAAMQVDNMRRLSDIVSRYQAVTYRDGREVGTTGR